MHTNLSETQLSPETQVSSMKTTDSPRLHTLSIADKLDQAMQILQKPELKSWSSYDLANMSAILSLTTHWENPPTDLLRALLFVNFLFGQADINQSGNDIMLEAVCFDYCNGKTATNELNKIIKEDGARFCSAMKTGTVVMQDTELKLFGTITLKIVSTSVREMLITDNVDFTQIEAIIENLTSFTPHIGLQSYIDNFASDKIVEEKYLAARMHQFHSFLCYLLRINNNSLLSYEDNLKAINETLEELGYGSNQGEALIRLVSEIYAITTRYVSSRKPDSVNIQDVSRIALHCYRLDIQKLLNISVAAQEYNLEWALALAEI